MNLTVQNILLGIVLTLLKNGVKKSNAALDGYFDYPEGNRPGIFLPVLFLYNFGL